MNILLGDCVCSFPRNLNIRDTYSFEVCAFAKKWQFNLLVFGMCIWCLIENKWYDGRNEKKLCNQPMIVGTKSWLSWICAFFILQDMWQNRTQGMNSEVNQTNLGLKLSWVDCFHFVSHGEYALDRTQVKEESLYSFSFHLFFGASFTRQKWTGFSEICVFCGNDFGNSLHLCYHCACLDAELHISVILQKDSLKYIPSPTVTQRH